MRVSVLINSKAGSVNADLIEEKVRASLFRCDLRFCRPQCREEMVDFLHNEIECATDNIIICGGDGTINVVLQALMKLSDRHKIPPLAIVRSGTANDLAQAMGISNRIEFAVRNIFEGVTREIDVIQLRSLDQTAYMITNGGLGMPAKAAELANKFRNHLQNLSTSPKSAKAFQYLAEKSYFAVKRMGPHVYSMMAAEAIRTWNPEGWGLDIEIPGKPTLTTTSPLVLINNQKNLGAGYLPAPFTSNTDGTVNLLLSESNSIPGHALATYHLRRGSVSHNPAFKTFELKEFKLTSHNPSRALTFFGDGEILFKDVPQISVTCIHKGLPVVVPQ